MTAVFFVMGFDIAPIVIWIFELPLDQEIRAVSVIRILLCFERGLVVVAIAEDRSGYVVRVKVHDSPQLHTHSMRRTKAAQIIRKFKASARRGRSGSTASRQGWPADNSAQRAGGTRHA